MNLGAPIIPMVDFNGDGMVDVKDVVVMTEHWGEHYPLCDIGPMPLGDGIVDVQDLAVLVTYIEPADRTLIGHWALDEAGGEVARDGAGGDHNGALVGNPVWQPAGGKIGGALLLDGVDDYIATECTLNPAAGPFSVFAWIKGGGPGQVILSQEAGMDWLLAEPATGYLMTELRSSGRFGRSLRSQTVITDGAWHRVGFVWDGSHHILYVDGSEVARDAPGNLAPSIGGLQIGAGSTLAAGTFWSGLIDDIRIYNRAVTP